LHLGKRHGAGGRQTLKKVDECRPQALIWGESGETLVTPKAKKRHSREKTGAWSQFTEEKYVVVRCSAGWWHQKPWTAASLICLTQVQGRGAGGGRWLRGAVHDGGWVCPETLCRRGRSAAQEGGGTSDDSVVILKVRARPQPRENQRVHSEEAKIKDKTKTRTRHVQKNDVAGPGEVAGKKVFAQ